MEKELNFLIYNTPDEDVSIHAVVKDESIWAHSKSNGRVVWLLYR